MMNSVNRINTLHKDFVSESVKEKLYYQDVLHYFSNNKGFRNEHKHVIGIIKKYKGCDANTVVYKLKNHIKYIKNSTFKIACDFLIPEIICKGEQVDDAYFSILHDNGIEIKNNVIHVNKF